MNELIKRYGTYEIKKGTILFRRARSIDIFENMFFGFNLYATYSSGLFTSPIQIWETTDVLYPLFMVKGKTKGGRPISAIIDIYNSFCPHQPKEQSDDVSLKQDPTPERDFFFHKLKENNITGWTTTLEGKMAMELCLFGPTTFNRKMIRFVQNISKDNQEYDEHESFDNASLKNLPIIYSR